MMEAIRTLCVKNSLLFLTLIIGCVGIFTPTPFFQLFLVRFVYKKLRRRERHHYNNK
jgi:hypothetical protein